MLPSRLAGPLTNPSTDVQPVYNAWVLNNQAVADREPSLQSRYGAALLFTAGSLLVTLAIRPLIETETFDLFQGAVFLSAWYAGLGPGLLAALLSSLAINFLSVDPAYRFSFNWTGGSVNMVIFWIVALITSSLSARLKAAQADLSRLFRSVLVSMGDGVAVLDGEGKFAPINPAAETLFGAEPLRVPLDASDNPLGLFKPDQTTLYRMTELPFAHALQGETSEETEIFVRNLRHPQGVWISCTVSPLISDGGLQRGCVMVFRDISDRKNAEKEVLEITSREQRRLGQDLHDGLCQTLAGVRLLAEALRDKLMGKSLEEADEVGKIQSYLQQALSQADTVARGLYPVELETNGLAAALLELTQKITKTFPVKCRFTARSPVLVHDGAVAAHLYRIAQEAVINAIKSGKATQITVRLFAWRNEILLTISDNGVGIQVDRMRKGMGMKIMNYRARVIQGTLEFKKRRHGGTMVGCAVSAAPSVTVQDDE